jgi:hypothetical protein
MGKVSSVVDTVLGEAKAGDYQDMLGIVSVIDNRSKSLNVSYKDVVAAKGQFDAYGKSLPAGVGKYRDMALQAIAEVRSKGPVHQATFYATPAAVKGLPKGLAFETKTAGHQYYSDPKGRAIATTEGYKTPDMTALAQNYAKTPEVGPTPTSRPEVGPTETAYAPAAEVDTSPFDAVMGVARGLDDAGRAGVVGVSSYNPGATRSEDPTSTIADEVAGLLSETYGGKYSVGVFSAKEPRGIAAVGSGRHTAGKAIDFDVIDTATGKPAPQDVVDATRQSLAARGYNLGIGNTKGYMTPGRTHVDRAMVSNPAATAQGFVVDPSTAAPISARSGTFWGGNPTSRANVAEARMSGLMAPAYYDAKTVGNPAGVPTPTPAPRSATVERGLLSDVTPAMTQDYSVAPGLMANIDQASLAAPAMTGPAARGVSTQSITPDNPTVASQQRGRVDPSASQMAGLAQALNDQAASLQSKDQEGLFGGLVSSAAAATQEQAGAAGRAMGALAGPETQAFSQQAFNDMTGPIGMPVAGPSFGPMETMDDAKRDADTLGRENAVLSGLEAAAKRDAEAARAAPTAPAGPQMGIAGTQSSAPSAPTAPTATAADVWGGKATVGTATNGNQVSRNPDGTISMTSSKYGYTDTYAPDGSFRGTTAPGLFGIDDAAKGLFGGFGKGTQAGTAQATAPARSFSDAMESFSGKGAMRGAMMGAPAGLLGLVAGALMGGFGKKGQQAAPTGLFSGGIMTADEAARAYALGYTPGLGFPANPGGPTQGGLTAKGEAASRGEFGGQAAHAADNPGTGLF